MLEWSLELLNCCLLTLISLEQQAVFVSHSNTNSHVFPFKIPKVSNFPVKQPKLREDGEYMRHVLSS